MPKNEPPPQAFIPFGRAAVPAVVPVADAPADHVAPRPRPPDNDEELAHDEPPEGNTHAPLQGAGDETPVEATMDLDIVVAEHRSPVDRGAKKPLTLASGAARRRGISEPLREKSAESAAVPTPLESASVAYSACVGDRECLARDVCLASAVPPEDSDMRDIVGLFDVSERGEARSRVEGLCVAIHALGGDGQAYRRDRASAARKIVSEIYSAPRVTAAARRLPKYGMMPGLALDITVGDDTGMPFDFSVQA